MRTQNIYFAQHFCYSCILMPGFQPSLCKVPQKSPLQIQTSQTLTKNSSSATLRLMRWFPSIFYHFSLFTDQRRLPKDIWPLILTKTLHIISLQCTDWKNVKSIILYKIRPIQWTNQFYCHFYCYLYVQHKIWTLLHFYLTEQTAK